MLTTARFAILAAVLHVPLLAPASPAWAKAPHPCILQPGDVPSDYEQDTPYREMTNDAVLARSENPNLVNVIKSTGRVTGFEIVYAHPSLDALMNGPIAIQSWVTIFDNPDGAHAVLQASARGEIIQAPDMGEESIGWKTPPRVGPDGLGSVVIGYAFRRSPDEVGWTELVGISVGSLDGVADIATVSDLLAILRARGCT